jgi:hypothetical protein
MRRRSLAEISPHQQQHGYRGDNCEIEHSDAYAHSVTSVHKCWRNSLTQVCKLDDSFGDSFVRITLVTKLESCARHFECDAMGMTHPLSATERIMAACQSGDGLSY